MTITEKYFLGQSGEVYAKINGNFLPLFNTSVAKITQSEKETSLKNYMSKAGGKVASKKSIEKAELELTIHSIHNENMELLLKATSSVVTAGTVTDEAFTTVTKSSLIRLANINVSNVIVKNTAGTVTYVENTDYVVKGAGVYIPATSTITGGIKVSYSYGGYNAIQALVESATDISICIDGLNKDNDTPVVVDIYKVAFGYADAFDFIGEEYGAITIKGEILADTTRPAGDSQYYTIYTV